MEDLYISSATATSTNNNVDDLPKKKWNGRLTILPETVEDFKDDGDAGGKPPAMLQLKEVATRNRRKSWQMGRLDKKRRKSVSTLSPIPDSEQLESTFYKSKNSKEKWWNIFTPDHWPR